MPRNVRHQGHCAELARIRERARDKREQRERVWEERRERRRAQQGGTDQQGSNKSKETAGEDTKAKAKRVRVNPDDSSSDEEGWNGGLWMFRGTLNMEKEREKKEKEAALNLQDNSNSPVSGTGLVNYENGDSEDDDDGPPEEIKTIVSYDNEIVEDTLKPEKDGEGNNASKKPRKRKKKQTDSSGGVAQQVEDTGGNKSEEALKSVRDTIHSHIQSFDNPPPIPGEEDNSGNQEKVENIPDGEEGIPDETPEDPNPSPHDQKPNVPVVFRKRLRPPTLLERLLLSEIKTERNTILQCVRYVCKNNFFQEPQ